MSGASLFEIRQMLDPDPDERPKATDICSSLITNRKSPVSMSFADPVASTSGD